MKRPDIALVAKRLLSPYVGFIIWYEQELRPNVFTVPVYRICSKSAALYRQAGRQAGRYAYDVYNT